MTTSRALLRRRRLGGLGFVLLAMGGTMTGHALVWSLVGGASPGLAAARSVHNYLRPVGAVLFVLAVCASWTAWRALAVLHATAARLRRAPWTPDTVPLPPHSRSARPTLSALWAALGVVQLCVYGIQENIEAHVAHVQPPGIHVLTAQLGAPIVLHAAVALSLAAIVSLLWIVLDRRHRVVEQLVRLVRAVTARRGLVRPPAVATGSGPIAPLARFGLSFSSRPPPVVVG